MTKEEKRALKEEKRTLREEKKTLKKAKKENTHAVDRFDDVIDGTKKVGKAVEKGSKAFWADFKKFVAKGNVVDLAIAVVVGAAFNKMMTSIVSGIITPLTSMLLKTQNLSELEWILRPAVEANEELGIEAVSAISLQYGLVIQATLDFLVIALSIFVTLKIFMQLKNTITKREREAAAAKAKEAADRKKAEAEAEAARIEKIKNDFINDVAAQADILQDIKEIMLRIEKRQYPDPQEPAVEPVGENVTENITEKGSEPTIE